MTSAVVVGASVAGVRTAQALRREGYPGDVVVIGDESDLPYDKPPLSKALLAGTTTIGDIRLITRDIAMQLHVDLRLGVPAAHVEVAKQQVFLEDGTVVPFDHLVLATGTRARPSPWGEHRHLHLLRTADDCRRLAADLREATALVIIGAGFIGSEVASTAAYQGLAVTMVDPQRVPMSGVLGEEVGRILTEVHRANGVTTRFGLGVQRIIDVGGRLVMELTDGSQVSGDVAVVGIGSVPNTEWLEASGLAIDDGVVCDEFCRAANHANIFAVGDLARWWHPRHATHRRVEHWTHACEQAACVAHNICHSQDLWTYDPVDYVWSDQYDWRIQIAGHSGTGCTAECFGDPQDGRFAVLFADDDSALTGAVTISWPKAMLAVRRLLVKGADIAAGRAAIAAVGQHATVPP